MTYVGTYFGKRGEVQPHFETLGRKTYAVIVDAWNVQHRKPAGKHEADLISSELPSGQHAPVIDIDLPIRAIASTTDDHWHLYIDKPMSWRKYKRLLRALVAAGVVEKGYYRASKERGGTQVRLPWVEKVAA